MTNWQSTVIRLSIFVSPSFLMPFIKPTFWNSYFKILFERHYQGNDDQFPKYYQTPRNHRFQEIFAADHQSDILVLLL